MPLAQMNTPSGGAATAGAPAAPVAAPVAAPAPAAPVAARVAASGPETNATAPGSQTQADTRPGTPPGLFGSFGPLIPMALILGALYFFLTRGQRKEEKRRKSMMSDLKKGDRVMTIGGMLASVVSVDDDRVVLKIDESNNVKATYRKSAIQEVVDRDEKKS